MAANLPWMCYVFRDCEGVLASSTLVQLWPGPLLTCSQHHACRKQRWHSRETRTSTMLVAQHLPHATINCAACKQRTVSVIVGISALCGRRFFYEPVQALYPHRHGSARLKSDLQYRQASLSHVFAS